MRKLLRYPGEIQRAKLRAILERNADTVYGRQHGFSRIRNVRDYQKRVPINTFEALRSSVERMAHGEANVLTSTAPLMFARTSGTSGAPKLIPVTPEFRDEYYSRIWFLTLLCRYPSSAAPKSILSVAGSAAEDRTEADIPIGSISGHLYQRQRPGIRARYVLPYEVFSIRDLQARYYSLLRFALEASVRIIVTPNPSTLLLLTEKAKEHAEAIIEDIAAGRLRRDIPIESHVRATLEADLAPNPNRARELARLAGRESFRPTRFWPRLQAICCWLDGPARLYLNEVTATYEGVPLHNMGYLASEGRGSLPFGWSGRTVTAVGSHFFEFIPEEAREEASPPALTVEQLEVGRRYFIVFTTSGGLYRYDIDDVVAVTGQYLGTPVLEFIRKGSSVHSFTGEKVTEDQVTLAMEEAIREVEVAVAFFVLVPEWGRPPRYRLLVEHREPAQPDTDGRLAEVFDQALQRLNIEYRSKRSCERLAAVATARLRMGSYATYRRHRGEQGSADAQFKVSSLCPKEGPLVEFLKTRCLIERGSDLEFAVA